MKKLILLFTALAFVACSSDDDNSGGNLYLNFTANGEGHEFTDPITTVQTDGLNITGRTTADFNDPGYVRLTIWFPPEVTTGTFDFTGDLFEEGLYKLRFASNPMGVDGWATGGSVTVTSVSDEIIEGTFTASFISEDGTVSITSGTFKAKAYMG